MFQGKTITKIILSETEVRVNFWLVSFECSHCVRNGRQGKEVSYELSWFLWYPYSILVDVSKNDGK